MPEWTAHIASDARLADGTAGVPLGIPFDPLKLSWSAVVPEGDGLHWDIALNGPAVKVFGDGRLSWWPENATLTLTSGTIELSELTKVNALIGTIRLQSGMVELKNLFGVPVPSGSMSGRMSGLRVEDADLGSGVFEGVLRSDGNWIITFTAEGGNTAADGSLSGAIGQQYGQFVLRLDDPAALPARAATLLQKFGQAGADGLTLSVPVPLR